MTRWVRWEGSAYWHAVKDEIGFALICHCGSSAVNVMWPGTTVSNHEPVEDECRLCRRALDGGERAVDA